MCLGLLLLGLRHPLFLQQPVRRRLKTVALRLLYDEKEVFAGVMRKAVCPSSSQRVRRQRLPEDNVFRCVSIVAKAGVRADQYTADDWRSRVMGRDHGQVGRLLTKAGRFQ